jgi:3-oxo-5-alpha-steroid 4-dehydrogenase 1
MDVSTFNTIIYAWIGLGLIIFIVLLFVAAPYGRHSKRTWGKMMPNKLGWVLMELPSLILFSVFYLFGPNKPQLLTLIFVAFYLAHYINRSLIYPFRTRTKGKEMPILIAFFAICFNLINGSLNVYYFSAFSREYRIEWLYDIRFILGMIFFITGAVINMRSDHYLLHLRRKSGNGYQLPRGGLFNYVSCPNFFGEILEWTGFAIMTWSPAALAFALWTFFNLVPRALAHHKWYRKEFPD